MTLSLHLQILYSHRMANKAKQARRKDPAFAADVRAMMEGCACWQARALARRVTQFYDEKLAEAGLSISQFGLLAHVAGVEDGSLGALAERAGLDQSTLTRNLQLLEREGWVEIGASPGDQRRRSVWLTEAGVSKLKGAKGAWAAAQAAVALLPELGVLPAAAKAAKGLQRPD
jgi:DNA-binding MarR family transcriptional regulator